MKKTNEEIERVSIEILTTVNHIIGHARLQGRFNLCKKIDGSDYDRFQELEDEEQKLLDSNIEILNDLLNELN